MASEKELLSKLIERWSGACADASGKDEYKFANGQVSFAVPPSLAHLTETLTRLTGVPSNAQQQGNTWTWESVADTIFAKRLVKQGYELRKPQLHMARMVQRADEMKQHAVVEAGTGTGKSYAYLYPAMELGLRIVVSTSNKALQAQLVTKDIPNVLRSYPGKKFSLVQGRSNYACKYKATKLQLTGDLATWYNETTTGNTEEVDFPIDYTELSDLTADDGCTGRHCSHRSDCFYYAAKDAREDADILVCNHAILALHLANPDAGILPGEFDMIVVDEAHKLADYIRSTHGSEVKLSTINHYIDDAKRSNVPVISIMKAADLFDAEIQALSAQANPHTLRRDYQSANGQELAKLFNQAAHIIFPEGDVPMNAEARQEWRKANNMRHFANRLLAVSGIQPDGYTRWVEKGKGDALAITLAPWNIAQIMKGILYPPEVSTVSRAFCADCGCDLADTVAVLNKRGYCADCIADNDPMNDAEFMSFAEYITIPLDTKAGRALTPFLFCSATLATPKLESFMAQMGIQSALQVVAPSPFDFAKNTVLYVPNGTTPAPNEKTFTAYLADEMRRLAIGSKGGAFLLFTSYANMKMVLEKIEQDLISAGLSVYVQGKNTKQQIVNAFRSQSNCVLFATKSFWEGVDIQGDNLRTIVIDKLPFPAPHPLTEAIKAAGAGNWHSVDLPLAITDLKQGVGRLIRTANDKGVIAVLDTRIRTAQYGRDNILPSLPPSPLVSNYWQAIDFLKQIEGDRKLSPIEVFGAEREFMQPVEIDGVVF